MKDIIAHKKTDRTIDPALWTERHGNYLQAFALQRTRNGAIAEDLVQETYLAAIKARHRFTGRSSERTWLTGILKHKIADYYRTAGREMALEDEALATRLKDAEHASFDRRGHWAVSRSSWRFHPVEALEQSERADMLKGCLGQLKGRLRAVFTLRELQGQSATDICRALKISESNLWVSLHRARARLKSCLEGKLFGKCCQ